MDKKTPTIIILEGLDGVGKTTIMDQLVKILKKKENKVGNYRVPSILSPTNYNFLMKGLRNPNKEMRALTILTAVLDEMQEVCDHWFSHCDYLIFDRSFYSTFVYQIGEIENAKLRTHMFNLVKSIVGYKHVTVYIEETQTVRRNRIFKAQRNQEKEKDQLDQFSLENHDLLNERYKEIIPKLNPKQHMLIKGNRRSAAALAKEIISRIEENQFDTDNPNQPSLF